MKATYDPSDLDDYTRRYCAWTPRGVDAYESTRGVKHTLFGGGKGGSKTVTGVRIFQTDISNYRDGVFLIMRKNYTALETTTKQSFNKFFIPDLVIEKTEQRWYCDNNNQILFHAYDRTRDKNYEKLRGLECTAVMVDEASEGDDELFEILPSLQRTSAHHIDTGEPLPHYLYYTTNPKPGKNYLKRTFIDPRTKARDGRHRFIKSLAKDNPFNPAGYEEEAFADMSEPLRRMLRDGDWDVDQSEFVIIPQVNLDAISVMEVSDRSPVSGGIDIGLGSPDKTVVYATNAGGQMFKYAEYSEYDTMRQVELLRPFCEAVKARGGSVFIDTSGVGKGVVDRLMELYSASTVTGVNFGESPVPELRKKTTKVFQNRRAQLFWWAREDAVEKRYRLHLDYDLIEELENTWYEEDSVKIKIVPKDEIKRRIGRSPDSADALVLANAARRRTQLAKEMVLPSVQTRKQISNYQGY